VAVLSVGAVSFGVVALGSAEASASSLVATVTIVDGLPGFTADIYLNGKLQLDGFEPTTATAPLRLDAGTYRIAIRNVGQSAQTEPLLVRTLSFARGANYTIVAHRRVHGDPAIALFRNDTSRVPIGKARLIVRDVAAVPDLMVRLDGKRPLRPAPNSRTTTMLLAPGRYSVDAVRPGGVRAIIATPLVLREGAETIVYAVGTSADGSLGFMAQVLTHLSSRPSEVPTGSGGLGDTLGMPPAVAALVAVGLALVVLSIARRVSYGFVHRADDRNVLEDHGAGAERR
jgi:hypothetical protein